MQHAVPIEERSRVLPGPGGDRRLMEPGSQLLGAAGAPSSDDRVLERFRIPLLDHAEAAELTLLAVEVAVVIGEARHEPSAAHMIERLDPLDDVHRKRRARDPWRASP